MPVAQIVQIIIGLFVWKVLPALIKPEKREIRQFVSISCAIIGIAVVIFGVISAIKSLLNI